MNCLFVVTQMRAGGLETYLVNVLSTPVFKQHRAVIVCLKTGDGFFDERLRKLNVEVVHCPSTYVGAGFCSRLARIIKQFEIDVVCDFRNDFSFPSMLTGMVCGVKSRCALYRSSRRAFQPSFLKNVYSRLMHYFTFCSATGIICNTRIVLENFYPKRNPKDRKFSIVHNGVDVQKFRPYQASEKDRIKTELKLDGKDTIIGHVGRFHKAKNHNVIIETVAMLLKKSPRYHLLLVGDGELRQDIEARAREFGISQHITMAGVRNNVPDFLNAMDIFFYPSLYEGLPNAVLEAMACGLPIVSSNIPEIMEILSPEARKTSCGPDDLAGFAYFIEQVLHEKLKRQDLGGENVKWVHQRFKIETSARHLASEMGVTC